MANVHFGVDASEVNRLAVDLSRAPGRMRTRAEGVMYVAANKIKKGMKHDASGHAHLPHLADHVSYDKIGQFDYEIGFNKVGQGNLANIAAFGSVNNAPVFDHTAALRRETPHVIQKLAEAAEDEALGESDG